ncbi:MAG: hypothetical protein ACLRXQ_13380 [Phascolarctobacterium faecium]
MTVTCTETAECDKWAEIVALAQQGNKKMLGVILQAFDIKLRKIAHTSAFIKVLPRMANRSKG